jgi:chromosome segregation ATPase
VLFNKKKNNNKIIILLIKGDGMDISTEIRTRIIAAADQLYQESDRERFPTVDQVRRSARADMNTTSVIMKEWRRQQTAVPAAVAAPIPDRVRDAALASAAITWSESQELSNESLDIAKAAWETERADAEDMRAELADAYELQAEELESTTQALTGAQTIAKSTDEKCQTLATELTRTTENLKSEEAKRAELERREQVAQRRVEELRAELSQEKVNADLQAKQQRAELDTMREKLERQATVHVEKLAAAQKQFDTAAQELATVKARAEAQQEAAKERQESTKTQAEQLVAELEKARKSAADAREKAAELTGQIGAVTTQNTELMAMIEKPKTANK